MLVFAYRQLPGAHRATSVAAANARCSELPWMHDGDNRLVIQCWFWRQNLRDSNSEEAPHLVVS